MSTALDRVGIRRMMLYIEKQVCQLVRKRELECNSPKELLNLREQCATEVLKDVKERKGIFDFKIEQIEPTKSKAIITFREGLEPITMIWEMQEQHD